MRENEPVLFKFRTWGAGTSGRMFENRQQGVSQSRLVMSESPHCLLQPMSVSPQVSVTPCLPAFLLAVDVGLRLWVPRGYARWIPCSLGPCVGPNSRFANVYTLEGLRVEATSLL